MAQVRVGFLVDTSRCIGCRSCQVACKAWNHMDADKTVEKGSYENPTDLTPNLYNRIRFLESADDRGDVKWLFMNERCVHCGDAGCMKVCPAREHCGLFLVGRPLSAQVTPSPVRGRLDIEYPVETSSALIVASCSTGMYPIWAGPLFWGSQTPCKRGYTVLCEPGTMRHFRG